MTRVMYLLLNPKAVPTGQLRSKKIGVSPNSSPLNPELTGSSFPHRELGSLLYLSTAMKSVRRVVQSSMLITTKSNASPPLCFTPLSREGIKVALVRIAPAAGTTRPAHVGYVARERPP